MVLLRLIFRKGTFHLKSCYQFNTWIKMCTVNAFTEWPQASTIIGESNRSMNLSILWPKLSWATTESQTLKKCFSSFAPAIAQIGTTSANSIESDLGCASRVFFDNVTLTSHNVTLTSQKPRQYNNKYDCSETNSYNIPHDAINESIKYRYSDILLKDISIFYWKTINFIYSLTD